MEDRTLTRGLAAAGAFAMGAGVLVAVIPALPAVAAVGACPEGSIAIVGADGVCEMRFTASGTYTPPSGIAKLTAVLVGGGGSGSLFVSAPFQYASAGDGGAVVYIDSVPMDAPVEFTVGAGGVANGTDGTATSIGAASAAGGTHDRNVSCADQTVNGSGARTEATSTPCAAGVGYRLSEIVGIDPALYPAAADGEVFGSGGTSTVPSGFFITPPPVSLGVPDDGGFELVADTSPFAGTGGSVDSTSAAGGAGGVVIFRFAAPVVPDPVPAPAPAAPAAVADPALASSGMDFPWAVPPIAAGLVGLGAALLAVSRRRGRTPRQPR